MLKKVKNVEEQQPEATSDVDLGDLNVLTDYILDYANLIKQVARIDEKAAAYLYTTAPKLDSFLFSGNLRSAFVWETTPQGREYWKAIGIRVYYKGNK